MPDEYKEVILDTRLTPNLCMEGISAEINRIVADAKKKAQISPEDNITISILVAISFDDLKKYTDNENERINKNKNL